MVLAMASVVSLAGCTFKQTCKEPGCDETNIYQDGYCKYHYGTNQVDELIDDGEEFLKDLINGN